MTPTDRQPGELLLRAHRVGVHTTTSSPACLLEGVDLEIRAGDVVGVTGRSGAGKSVLARTLAGNTSASGTRSEGSLFLGEGPDLYTLPASHRARLAAVQIGVVSQNPSRTLNPLRPVRTQIAETVQLAGGVDRRGALASADHWLARVGLSALAGGPARFPHQLSGGMCQRIAIALALCRDQRLVVADEPTSALDPVASVLVTEVLTSIARHHGGGVVMVGHDLATLASACTRLVVLDHGRIVEHGPVARVLSGPTHPVTCRLVECTRRASLR